MHKLNKPTDDAGALFRICISKVRNEDLKRRLESCASIIIEASKDFAIKANDAKLHLIPSVKSFNGLITKEEMINVYNLRMAKKDSPGRSFYDKLMALPVHGKCPLCGHRTVSTLDHYLPKAHYPVFSVIPLNLIPACKDCNTAKIDCIPTHAEQQTIHPYYDDIDSEMWLNAKLIKSSPPIMDFFVSKPKKWSDLLGKRVENHFKTLGLSSLYASNSAVELLNINFSLENLYREVGKFAVKEYLLDSAESRRKVDLNSWQTAMYRTISESNWFCDGGFRL